MGQSSRRPASPSGPGDSTSRHVTEATQGDPRPAMKHNCGARPQRAALSRRREGGLPSGLGHSGSAGRASSHRGSASHGLSDQEVCGPGTRCPQGHFSGPRGQSSCHLQSLIWISLAGGQCGEDPSAPEYGGLCGPPQSPQRLQPTEPPAPAVGEPMAVWSSLEGSWLD